MPDRRNRRTIELAAHEYNEIAERARARKMPVARFVVQRALTEAAMEDRLLDVEREVSRLTAATCGAAT